MTTSSPYIDVQLKPNDEAGYASAGILPWRRVSGELVEFLLAREYRTPNRDRGGDLLNFLGGKRHKRETDALSAFQALPKPDVKKLKLRFHPDRLMRALGRQPSEDESALCTCVMQILNGLADANGGKDVMESLKKASASRCGLLKQGDQASNQTQALRDMLENLKM